MLKIQTIRHSLSHILAMAVKDLHPKAKFGIGPDIENGFYYDFDLPSPLSPDDLPKIEEKIRQIIKKDVKFKKQVISKAKAKKLFENQPYKLELIKGLPGKNISVYESDGFVDLCRGPHIKSGKDINPSAFKLARTAGAYWLGDEKNKMLTRIYGLAFKTKKELKDYLKQKQEAEKRDHRLLGKKLGLFLIDEEFGSGLPLWLPKGAVLRKVVMDFTLKTYLKKGYQLVATPHIANLKLWQRSGHWDFYQENMYSPIKVEKDWFMIKPMNCPGHVKIYNSKIRSYKNLPLRFTEMGTVYRYERSGTLHGLTRVRGFTQDDAHIFCKPEQLAKELLQVIDLTKYILNSFGFKDFEVSLSVRDSSPKKKYLGTDKIWQLAESSLENALKAKKLKYKRYAGEAVFYGPKIDLLAKDSLNRKWQLTTIQVDFNLPEKFDITYIDKQGKKQRPVMIHQALLGSVERFIGVLLEHYGAAGLPLWLAPEQIWVMPIAKEHKKYAKEVIRQLAENCSSCNYQSELRCELKDENETLSKKIRQGEIQKIPYLLVVGGKEMKAKSVRARSKNKDLGMIKLNKLSEKIKQELKAKK